MQEVLHRTLPHDLQALVWLLPGRDDLIGEELNETGLSLLVYLAERDLVHREIKIKLLRNEVLKSLSAVRVERIVHGVVVGHHLDLVIEQLDVIE